PPGASRRFSYPGEFPVLSLQPSVSIVIRAKNAARYIGDALAPIFDKSALRPRQAVAVASGATGGTQDVGRPFPTTPLQTTPDEFSYGYARKLGARHVAADTVATLSAHSLPVGPDWRRALSEPFSQPTVAGVYGRQRPRG